MEEIIELPPDVPGNITECGAYLGSSSAKLSLAAKQAGRTLMVCDSFEGLPETQASDDPFFQRGQYAGRLEVVRRHVAKFGALDAVRFVAGWFDDTLPSLRGTPIACAFWDVDLQHSFRSCIRELWPGVAPGAKVFIHDVNRAAVVSVFTDALWWSREMGTAPPPLSGALTGLGRSAPHLGYVVKPG